MSPSHFSPSARFLRFFLVSFRPIHKNLKGWKLPPGSNGKWEKRHVAAYESTDVDWLQQY